MDRNFLAYETWRWGRISVALYFRLMVRPLYPNMRSSSPKMEYVNLGLKLGAIGRMSPAGEGLTRPISNASFASDHPMRN